MDYLEFVKADTGRNTAAAVGPSGCLQSKVKVDATLRLVLSIDLATFLLLFTILFRLL